MTELRCGAVVCVYGVLVAEVLAWRRSRHDEVYVNVEGQMRWVGTVHCEWLA